MIKLKKHPEFSKSHCQCIFSDFGFMVVVTLSPPTSEAGVQFPARPQVGELVGACRWSAVYSTES